MSSAVAWNAALNNHRDCAEFSVCFDAAHHNHRNDVNIPAYFDAAHRSEGNLVHVVILAVLQTYSNRRARSAESDMIAMSSR